MIAFADLWDWLRAKRDGLSLIGYRAQQARLHEIDVEGDTAVQAAAMNTPEAAAQAAGQRAAFNDAIEALLKIPKRTHTEELQLVHLERQVRSIDAASGRLTTPQMLATPLSMFGAVGQRAPLGGLLGSITGLLTSRMTMVLAAGWALTGGIVAAQGLWGHHLRAVITAERAREHELENSLSAYAAQLGADRAAHARDVAAVLEDTARTVEQLQRREARHAQLEARERSRHEEASHGSVDFGQRLRELARPADAAVSASGGAAPGGGPASDLPTSTGEHPDAGGAR